MNTAHPRPEQDRSPRRPAPPLGREPMLVPSAGVLVRYNARVLDPASAVRRRPDEVIRPTVYVGNRLLVRGLVPGSVRYGVLAQAAKDHNLGLSYADADGTAEAARASTLGEAYPARMVLTPLTSPAAPADACRCCSRIAPWSVTSRCRRTSPSSTCSPRRRVRASAGCRHPKGTASVGCRRRKGTGSGPRRSTGCLVGAAVRR